MTAADTQLTIGRRRHGWLLPYGDVATAAATSATHAAGMAFTATCNAPFLRRDMRDGA